MLRVVFRHVTAAMDSRIDYFINEQKIFSPFWPNPGEERHLDEMICRMFTNIKANEESKEIELKEVDLGMIEYWDDAEDRLVSLFSELR